jgi:spore maturation protein CgeB
MELLHRNLEVLRRQNPELAEEIDRCAPGPEFEVLTASSGSPTVRINGRLEASAEDPEREAETLAAHLLARATEAGATRLVLFGLGVHTLRFLERFEGKLLVVEPSPELCRIVLERLDLSRLLGRFELIATSDPAPVIRHTLFQAPERGLFLSHPATRRRAPKLHDDLAQRFHPGGVASPLNVAVIPPLYGGSLPVAQACARALKQLGHYVRKIDFTPFWSGYQEIQRVTNDPRLASASGTLRAAMVRLIGETLLASFQLDPPDLVFAVAQAPLDPETLNRMGRMGITRAFWFCEDFHVMSYWRELARHYDTIFHVQPDELSEPLREAGGYGIPLHMAFDPSITRPVELADAQRERYGTPLSFLGAGYHNRIQFLPALIDLGLRIYGTEWPETPPYESAMPEPNVRQSPEASNLIFNATRVNLNLHSSPWCDGVNPVGDYLNPRTFELAGARAFQLVDRRRYLPELLQPGFELETFEDINECRKKIAYYLEHEDERQEIADNGYRRALAEHTYRHRMEEAVDALRAGPVPLAPRRSDLPTVGAVLESAGDEPGLTEVLRRLEADRIMDSDAITLAVGKGEGELSREEKLLLYMREALGELHYLNEVGQRV